MEQVPIKNGYWFEDGWAAILKICQSKLKYQQLQKLLKLD